MLFCSSMTRASWPKMSPFCMRSYHCSSGYVNLSLGLCTSTGSIRTPFRRAVTTSMSTQGRVKTFLVRRTRMLWLFSTRWTSSSRSSKSSESKKTGASKSSAGVPGCSLKMFSISVRTSAASVPASILKCERNMRCCPLKMFVSASGSWPSPRAMRSIATLARSCESSPMNSWNASAGNAEMSAVVSTPWRLSTGKSLVRRCACNTW
mmetsp:Transcript_107302/g.308723  ORF Transcript_107302/g.308723 Transcript_107302/m.308723 type:complete len:207 (-) Transcript_107302:3035-3655(-)